MRVMGYTITRATSGDTADAEPKDSQSQAEGQKNDVLKTVHNLLVA